MGICPQCGSVSDDSAEAAVERRCARCGTAAGEPIEAPAAGHRAPAASMQAAEPFADLEDVLRDTAAPLNDIEEILSEVYVPKQTSDGAPGGSFLMRFALAVGGVAVACLLVFALGKIVEFADEAAPQGQHPAPGGVASPDDKKAAHSVASSDLAPLNDGWTPEPEWLKELGPAARFAEFELQLPDDYSRVERTNAGGKSTCSFRSRNRSADDLNVVTTFIDDALADRGGVPEKLDPDWELDFMLDGYRSTLAHFAESGRDQGRLAGREFVRGRFTGKQAGADVCGVMLASYAERRMIVLSFICTSPPGSPEYKRLETALLTFRPSP